MLLRIKELRMAANMTQGQLAVEMGVNQNTVSSWELEVTRPKTGDLPQLAKVLGCTINDLFVDAPMPEAI